MTASPTRLGARIDMTQPLLPGAPRLVAHWEAPLRVLQADDAAQLQALLIEVEALARAGAWCVGGLRYEAASALNDKLVTQPAPGPLAWFGVYAAPGDAAPPPVAAAAATVQWQSGLTRAGFDAALQQIHQDIADGRVYQVNLTRVLAAPLPPGADVAALGAALAQGNPAPFSAVVRLPDQGIHVASASPERFLERDGRRVWSSPIKGTAATEDAFLAKDRAENVMIVDLVRNDLGRVCEWGTVTVPALCAVEHHPGLVHLVSTVEGRLRPGVSWADAVAATFPPGSVTGAPKVAALDQIAALEPARRDVYCGAVGWVDAETGRGALNVAIRTFWFAEDEIRFGTGGGITWDSDPAGEWAETELKARRLLRVAAGTVGHT